MKTSIFKTPRRGRMGNKPLGADYMPDVLERARRMQAVTEIRGKDQLSMATDDRQQRLPGF